MSSTRRAHLRTTHDDPEVVRAAVEPDNTDSMHTTVEGNTLVATIERDSTGGLQSTVDDYVVNVTVAQTVIDDTRTHTDTNHE
ncbi:KEOPS complex subunit Pcc1 [Haloferax namakaokahaiae]|uniref:KEOPS complex subunit Pcc1 n=1 Tax=Haloferax namakaokahaiae TaxID=1748331 RepID=A0ABD5ZFI8_9EURY